MLYRQINEAHAADWQHFEASGLYDQLVTRHWLVAHEAAPVERAFDDRAWRVVRPHLIDFISYPYEWTFSQLKDAALLTLAVQAAALEAGMTLKDASAFNVQFDAGSPVLIDALSFERLEPGAPWVAYRQFCQHFLAPLALMSQRDVRCGLLLREFIDGIPLELAARLLPVTSRLRFGQATHLHLHARAQRRHGRSTGGSARPRLSSLQQEALLSSLRSTVESLKWQPKGTEWADYGETTSYSERAANSKEELVRRFVGAADGSWVWDLGANTGRFSGIAANLGHRVLALDADPAAAELHYRALKGEGQSSVLPLVMDLVNPSPALGWEHRERRSLVQRANADVLLALALVHHLVIGNNVPLAQLSSFLGRLGAQLIVEFVPKSDQRVRAMLAGRRDVFEDYSLEGFRAAFAAHWHLIEEEAIGDSERALFRFQRR